MQQIFQKGQGERDRLKDTETDRQKERERENFEANLKLICEYQKRKLNLSLHQIKTIELRIE